MAYILPVVVFLLAYNKQRSKIITLLILTYMWILVGLNTYTPDYAEYERVYFNPTIWNVEIGYRMLCDFFRGLGFTFQQFRMIFGAAYILLIYRGISKNTEYKNLVLAMFLLWPFVPFVSGARFSFALAVFFNAVPYLYNRKKFATIKYIAIVGFSCLFHMGAIVFLAYLFARRKYTTKQYLIATAIVLCIVISIKMGLLETIAYRINIVKIIKWLNMSSQDIGRLNITGFISYSVILVANWFITSQVGKMALKGVDDNIQNCSVEELVLKRLKYTVFLNVNFLSMFIIPFYLISSEYQRYLNATLMLNYCLYAGFKKEQFNISAQNKRLYSALFLIVIILTALFYMYSQTSHDVLATFRDNLLFMR